MFHTRTFTFALVTALSPGWASAQSAKADDAEAKTIAVKVCTAGASLFDARDAPGLSATYLEDAKLEVIGKDDNSKEYRSEIKQGRAEIEAYYRELFKGDPTYHSKNTVEHARQIRPDLILFTGYFVPDTEAANPMRIPFVQTRVKQGQDWKIISLKIFVILD